MILSVHCTRICKHESPKRSITTSITIDTADFSKQNVFDIMIRSGSAEENRTELTMRLFHTLTRILPDTGCWEYRGAKDSQGYGRMFVARKERKAQRVVYELVYGSIPARARLRHFLPSDKCIRRGCCNPAHLRLDEHITGVAKPKGKGLTASPLTAIAQPVAKAYKKGHRITGSNVVAVTRTNGRLQTRCRICCKEKWAAQKTRFRAQKRAESAATTES
jgi:hypothetical protein